MNVRTAPLTPTYVLPAAPLQDGRPVACDNRKTTDMTHEMATVATLYLGYVHYLCPRCSAQLDAQDGAPIGPELPTVQDHADALPSRTLVLVETYRGWKISRRLHVGYVIRSPRGEQEIGAYRSVRGARQYVDLYFSQFAS